MSTKNVKFQGNKTSRKKHTVQSNADKIDKVSKVCPIFLAVPSKDVTYSDPQVPEPSNLGHVSGRKILKAKSFIERETCKKKKVKRPNTCGVSETCSGFPKLCKERAYYTTEENATAKDELLVIQAAVVKLYDKIKKEMELTTAKAIADHLYAKELLTEKKYQEIKNCRKRKPTAELLLRTVLFGNNKMQTEFRIALQVDESCSKNLSDIVLTYGELTAFKDVNYKNANTFASIPTDVSEKCKNIIETFQLDEMVLEHVIDKLLCRFCISIVEHCDIMNNPLGVEEKIKQLDRVLCRRPKEVFTVLPTVLAESFGDTLRTETVNKEFQMNINQRTSAKRKLNSDTGPALTKCKVFDTSSEYFLIKKVQSCTDVQMQAEEQLDFQINSVTKGSIIITLKPKDKDSWNKLKMKCENGSIKTFIPVIFNNADHLNEGQYRIDFTIRTKPGSDGEERLAEFHFESTQDNDNDSGITDTPEEGVCENGLNINLKLLLDDLEITEELRRTLRKNDIVDDNFEKDIKQIKERPGRIRFLLKKVQEHGDKGYELLKNYIGEKNKDLFEEMNKNEQSDKSLYSVEEELFRNASISTRTRSKTGVLFYSATVILDVRKEVITDPQTPKRKLGREVKVTVSDLLEPKCHFEKGAESVEKLDTENADDIFDLSSRKLRGERLLSRPASKRVKKDTKDALSLSPKGSPDAQKYTTD